LRDYTGSAHAEVNEFSRDGYAAFARKHGLEKAEQIGEYAGQLAKDLEDAPKLAGQTVHRGQGAASYAEFGKLQPGDEYTTPSTWSTSMRRGDYPGPVQIEIRNADVVPIERMSRLAGETGGEALIPPGSKMRVVSSNVSEHGTRHVVLEQLGAAKMEPAAEVPIAQVVAERRALQHVLEEDLNSNAVKWPQQEMREFTGELGTAMQKAIDDAPHTVGPGQGKALKDLNKDYQRLSYLQEAYKRRLAAHAALRHVSPTSYLAGGAVAAGSIAHGNPLGAAHGLAMALGHNVLLARGNAVASAALGKIAKLDLIARAAEKVDTEMEGVVRKFVTQGERASAPKIRLRHFASAPQADVQQRYDEAQKQSPRGPQPALGLEHVDRAIPGLAPHAPKTALALAAVVSKGSQYLQAQTPPAQASPGLLGRAPRPNDLQASSNLRIRGAVEDPVGTLKRGLETGKLAQDEIEAIKASKPKLFAQFQRTMLQTVSEHRDKMTYDKVAMVSKVIGMPLDPSLRPERVAALQQTFAGQPASPQQPGAAPKGVPKRQLKGLDSFAQLSTGNVDAGP
jgi:hypothetical protein